MNIAIFIRQAQKFAGDNAPAILTGMGVAGTVATAYLTGKATIKAVRIIDLAEDGRQNAENMGEPDLPPLTQRNKVELVWKLYIPPVAAGAGTIACIIGSHHISAKRAAALAAAYSITEKAYSEYKEKVVEKFGENKERQTRDDIAKDRVTNDPPGDGKQVIITGKGEVLCYEQYTGRYFLSNMETLRKAENDVNAKVYAQGGASLNDFYESVGLDFTSMSDEFGWDHDHPCKLDISAVLTPDNRPVLAFDYSVFPMRNYDRPFH